MTNLQHLLTDLENKQTELELGLKNAQDLQLALRQKHEQNLIDIQKNSEITVTKETLEQNIADQDKLEIDVNKLKLETADISNTLDEIFKL